MRPFAVLTGLRRLVEDEDLRFLQPYIAKVQAIDANVFDLSVTMVHPATNAEAFRLHYDITLSDHINHRASIGGLTVRNQPVAICALSRSNETLLFETPPQTTWGFLQCTQRCA